MSLPVSDHQPKRRLAFVSLALPVVVTLLCLAGARALNDWGILPDVAPALLAALLGIVVCWLLAAILVEISNGNLEFKWRGRRPRG